MRKVYCTGNSDDRRICFCVLKLGRDMSTYDIGRTYTYRYLGDLQGNVSDLLLRGNPRFGCTDYRHRVLEDHRVVDLDDDTQPHAPNRVRVLYGPRCNADAERYFLCGIPGYVTDVRESLLAYFVDCDTRPSRTRRQLCQSTFR